MAQFATIDAAGRLTGFYDDRVHTTLPAGTVELTPAQYVEWLDKQSQLVWDTATKTLVAAPAAAAPAAPKRVPQRVSAYQLKAQLFSMPGKEQGKTLLDDVNEFAAAAGGLTWLAWMEKSVFTRTLSTVAAVAAHFGWSEAQLDDMFTNAAAFDA